jgi:phospholipase C
VILYQENHSFDNVLGKLCVLDHRCDGAIVGRLPDGASIALSRASDLVPVVGHNGSGQTTAIDGGRMDGFGNLPGCTAAKSYACYTQFGPRQIPNLAALARHFVISGRTFEMSTIPSWGAHMELAAATLDGFAVNPGSNPFPSAVGVRPLRGWGCESRKDALWGGTNTPVPSCVPDRRLDRTVYPFGGAYRPSPVRYVPTIMDRLNQRGLSWGIYAGTAIWAVCPTFAECQDTSQKSGQQTPPTFISAAKSGTLPNLSIVTPTFTRSQHNGESMLKGDNWIGHAVKAVMSGPDWGSSAIFITYDDCGCFYDHIPPPPGMGIRVPMVIVSPYAKPGFTDSAIASYASMLAFVEHTFALAPLSSADANAYDYAKSFNYSQTPLTPIPLANHPVSRSEMQYIRRHPPNLRRDPT